MQTHQIAVHHNQKIVLESTRIDDSLVPDAVESASERDVVADRSCRPSQQVALRLKM